MDESLWQALLPSFDDQATVVTFSTDADSARDVLERVLSAAETLDEPITTLTIASHGRSSAFQLGQDFVTEDIATLDSDMWRQLGGLLAPDGRVLLLGCGVAVGGTALVDSLSTLTGASIYASNDPTGAGGDWDFEAHSIGAPALPDTGLVEQLAGAFESADVTLAAPAGPEFLVNTQTLLTQLGGRVAVAPTGEFVVVWQSLNQDALASWGVYAQRYDASGNPVGTEFRVNQAVGGDQTAPDVAIDADGNFVVTWSESTLTDTSIMARRYAATGAALGGEFTVFQSNALTLSAPAIGMDDAGNFVITWQSLGEDSGATTGIYAQRFDASGVAQGAKLLVNTQVSGNQNNPAIDMAPNGDFVIAYDGSGPGDTTGIFARRFQADGTALGGEFLVNTTVDLNVQFDADVSVDRDGNFVVVWGGVGLPDLNGVYARRFQADGTALADEFLVNDDSTLLQAGAQVSHNGDGGFIVTWYGQGPEDLIGIYMREYAPDGTGAATQSVVNTPDLLDQILPSIAHAAGTSFVVTWNGAGPGDLIDGVFARLYVNEVPTTTTTVAPLLYTEGDGQIAADDQIVIDDPDNVYLTGATITFTSGYVLGEDVLAFVNQLGITGAWNAAAGTLTLSGVATVADYQTALRAVTYENLSEDPSTAARTLSVVINDAEDSSSAATRTVLVTPVNDPPVVTLSATDLNYTEGDGAVAFDSAMTVTDVDDTTLSGAVVTFSAGYVLGEDVLSFVNQLGITGVWNAAVGTLTLSGAATLADYQTALRSITYSNTSIAPAEGTRTVQVSVNDGTDFSAPDTRDVVVAGVNSPPGATTSPSNLLYTEGDGAVAFDSGLTITDADNTTLAGAVITFTSGYVLGEDVLAFVNQLGITGVWNAAAGTLTLSGVAPLTDYQTALRSITYENLSDDPSTTARTVSVVVNDGTDPSSAATRTVLVTPVNDPPVVTLSATDLNYTEGDGAVVVDAALTISDVDSTTLSGTVITFSAGYVQGEDVLSFVNQFGITGSWNPLTGTLTLIGTATLADYQTALRSITYSNASVAPTESARTIQVVVSDGTDPSAPDTRDVVVAGVNSPPVVTLSATDLNYTEGDGAVAFDTALTVTDADDGTLTGAVVSFASGYVPGEDVLSFVNQLGITGVWNAAAGTLTLSGTATLADYQTALRSFTYSNASIAPTEGARTIQVVVSDGTDFSAPDTRNIILTGVNSPPTVTLSPSSLEYTEGDDPVLLDPSLTVTDLDSATLVSAVVSFSSGYVPGEDVLAFVSQFGISGAWDEASGTLTLTGGATVAEYQAALRSITYANADAAPTEGGRAVQVVVSDGIDVSLPGVRLLGVVLLGGNGGGGTGGGGDGGGGDEGGGDTGGGDTGDGDTGGGDTGDGDIGGDPGGATVIPQNGLGLPPSTDDTSDSPETSEPPPQAQDPGPPAPETAGQPTEAAQAPTEAQDEEPTPEASPQDAPASFATVQLIPSALNFGSTAGGPFGTQRRVVTLVAVAGVSAITAWYIGTILAGYVMSRYALRLAVPLDPADLEALLAEWRYQSRRAGRKNGSSWKEGRL